jgi:hypothetical protein
MLLCDGRLRREQGYDTWSEGRRRTASRRWEHCILSLMQLYCSVKSVRGLCKVIGHKSVCSIPVASGSIFVLLPDDTSAIVLGKKRRC